MNNIVLFEPEIPQNTGNIMRTCVATNTRLHLIKPFGFELNDKYLKRAGVNYIDKLEYYVYDDWDDFISKNEGFFFYYTRYGKKPHTSFNYKLDNDIYFVFGKESTGIDKHILKNNLDKCARIPMSSNVRSLNLSNTVAIVIYEALRQQDYNDLLFTEPHKGENFLEEGDF